MNGLHHRRAHTGAHLLHTPQSVALFGSPACGLVRHSFEMTPIITLGPALKSEKLVSVPARISNRFPNAEPSHERRPVLRTCPAPEQSARSPSATEAPPDAAGTTATARSGARIDVSGVGMQISKGRGPLKNGCPTHWMDPLAPAAWSAKPPPPPTPPPPDRSSPASSAPPSLGRRHGDSR